MTKNKTESFWILLYEVILFIMKYFVPYFVIKIKKKI